MVAGPLEELEWDKYSLLCAHLIRCDPLDITSPEDLSRDILVVHQRCREEGVSFLTKNLPRLGQALDLALETGRFTTPRGFHLDRTGSRPALLQAYFNLLFDEDGVVRAEAPAQAVKHVRQVCFFAYKLRLPYSSSQNEAVIAKFCENERELSLLEFCDTDPVMELAQRITLSVFHKFDPMEIVPRHGPGTVATGEKLDDKWVFTRKYQQIHRRFPYYDYFVAGRGREILDRLGWYRQLEPHESGTSKVVLVPKDSRGPRLISSEPLEYQWIQQGLGRRLAAHLECDSSHTRGQINFRDQGVNQQLALASSSSREFATVDLRDASDRVSLELVERVFTRCSNLLECLRAVRTTATKLPDGSEVPLNKFAPMGSAVCFPVESFVFWVLLVAASVWKTRLPLSRVGKSIFVYGDDIVVPSAWMDFCLDVLERFGLRVNRSKTYRDGFFRESCGWDAFKGILVTPVRLRTRWTGRKTDGAALASYASVANELRVQGYAGASRFLMGLLEQTYGKLPYGTERTGFPCRVTSSAVAAEIMNLRTHRWRWNPRLQRLEFKILSLRSRRVDSTLDNWPRLLRDLIVMPLMGDPSVVVVPRSTLIKRSWAAV